MHGVGGMRCGYASHRLAVRGDGSATVGVAVGCRVWRRCTAGGCKPRATARRGASGRGYGPAWRPAVCGSPGRIAGATGERGRLHASGVLGRVFGACASPADRGPFGRDGDLGGGSHRRPQHLRATGPCGLRADDGAAAGRGAGAQHSREFLHAGASATRCARRVGGPACRARQRIARRAAHRAPKAR